MLGQSERILRISDSEAGVTEEKSRGVSGGEVKCGDDAVGLLERERLILDILSVKRKRISLRVRYLEWRRVRKMKTFGSQVS